MNKNIQINKADFEERFGAVNAERKQISQFSGSDLSVSDVTVSKDGSALS